MNSIVHTIERAYNVRFLRGSPAELLTFVERCGRVYLRQFVEPDEPTPGRLRPSGFNCPRKKAFAFHGAVAEPPSFRTRTTFFLGDLFEAAAVLWAKDAGIDLRFTGAEQLTLATLLDDGHPDGIVYWDGAAGEVTEFKSMSEYTWKRFTKVAVAERVHAEPVSVTLLEDTFGYATQANEYAFAARDLGYIPEPRVRMVAINKMNMALGERVFVGDQGLRLRRAAEAQAVRASAAPTDLPRFPPLIRKDGARVLELRCAYCDYKRPCWEADGYALREERTERSRAWHVEGEGDAS